MPSLGNHVDAVFIPESVNTSTTLRINGGDLHLDDGKKALFGQSDDLQIYHDGTDSRVENSTGDIKLKNTGSYYFFDEDGGKTLASFINDGSVNLYHNGNKKFETTSTGVTVTGTALATALSTGASGTGINISTSTITGPATLTIDPAAIGDDTGLVIIKGDFQVDGTTTTVNSTTLTVDDKNLELGTGAANDAAADGGGITIVSGDGNKTFNFEATGDNLGSSENLNLASGKEYKINNTSVLSVTTLGSGVTGSSLTSVGTLSSLTSEGAIKFQTTASSAGQTAFLVEDGGATSTDVFRIYENGETVIRNIVYFGPSGAQSRINPDGSSIFLGDMSIRNGSTTNIFLNNSGEATFKGNLTIADKIIHDGDTDTAIRFPAADTFAVETAGTERLRITSAGVSVTGALEVSAATNITVGGTALPSLTGLLGGSLSGTLGAVTMSYLPAAPSSPVQGQFYFNSLSSKAQIYTGSAFVDLVPSGGGGGGGGGSSTDANATFRKYTYSISSTTSSVSGSSDLVTSAGSFVTGRKYTIKTVGTTDFTAIGASANTVGVVFNATGAGSGSGDAYDTLVYSTGDNKNVEVYVNGVKSVEGATNDYVATSGTSVNFVANLASGDVVDIQVYELLTNDAFVLASGGTFSGNVGINTSTINNRLHIHSNANDQGILLSQAGSNYSGIIADANRTNTDLYILNLQANWNGNGVARISMETGDDTTNKDDGRIKFSTSPSGGAPLVRMNITPSGNVGIGIGEDVDAGAILEVKGDGTFSGTHHKYMYGTDCGILVKGNEAGIDLIGSDAGNHASSILFRNSTEGFGFVNDPGNDALHLKSFTTTANGFNIHDGTGSSGLLEIITFVKAGNVGIGTNNPTRKLDVRGKTILNSSLATAESNVPLFLGLTATPTIDDGAGAASDSWFRLKDEGGSDNRVHGIDIRNRNSGDVRLVNEDIGTTNSANFAIGVDDGSGVTERFRIKGSDGFVGINTTAPTSQLHVRGTQIHLKNDINTGNTYVIAENTGAGNAGVKMKNSQGEWTLIANDRLRFTDDDNNLERFALGSDGKVYFGNQLSVGANGYILKEIAGDYKFNVFASSSTTTNRDITLNSKIGTEAVRIQADGKVGIGTAAPVQMLDVNGSAALYKRSGTDPTRLIMENSGSNLASSARIEFWEGSHVGAVTNNANACIEYDGSSNHGGDGAILIKGYTSSANQIIAGFSRDGSTFFNGTIKFKRTATYTSTTSISVTHQGASDYGSLYFDSSLATGGLVVRPGGTERFRVNSDGIKVSGAVRPTGGINFIDATDVASGETTTSSVLDDYEEGTFVPNISFGTGTTGITYGEQKGIYTKVGRFVWITVVITLTNKGSESGNLRISNLPFTASNNSDSRMAGGLNYYSGFANLKSTIYLYYTSNISFISAYHLNDHDGTANGGSAITDANVGNSCTFRAWIGYYTN